jgi:hypothetical protein
MPATEEALALRRKRNRDGQACYQARHFGSHGDLSRVRADVRLEARAALGRLAELRNLSLTELIEELSLEADRRTAQRLTGEARERYCAGKRERFL